MMDYVWDRDVDGLESNMANPINKLIKNGFVEVNILKDFLMLNS